MEGREEEGELLAVKEYSRRRASLTGIEMASLGHRRSELKITHFETG